MKEKTKKHEEMGCKITGNALKHGFIGNHPSAIDKAKKKCGSPDQFEDIFREYVFNQGGERLAERTIMTIVHGKDYIKNMKNYQKNISDYTIYSMALRIKDTGIKPSQDIILDQLASKINLAVKDFGYSDSDLPYNIQKDENGCNIYEDKLLINPYIIDDIDITQYSDDQKPIVENAINQYKENQKKDPIPTGKELFENTDGRIIEEPVDAPVEEAGAEKIKSYKEIKKENKDKIFVTLEDIQRELDAKAAEKAARKLKKNKAVEKTEEHKSDVNANEEIKPSPKSTSNKEIIDVEATIIEAEEAAANSNPSTPPVQEQDLKKKIDDPMADLVQDIINTASTEANTVQKEGAKSS